MAVTAISMTVVLINACGPLLVRKQHTYPQSNPRSVNAINGGFGYKFGEVLDKSRVISQSYTNNPLTEGYLVSPIISNETIDHFNVEVCKRTKRIYSISGFKIYNNKDLAMRRLRAARRYIEDQYGPLKKLPEKADFYAEYVKYGPCEIRLIATPGNFDLPKWGFIIMYKSDEHEQQCK